MDRVIRRAARHLLTVLTLLSLVGVTISFLVLRFIVINKGIPPSSVIAWIDSRTGEPASPQPVVKYIVVCTAAIFVLGLPLIFASARFGAWLKSRRRIEAGHCPKCGYDLRATPDRCPECGTVVGSAPREAAGARS